MFVGSSRSGGKVPEERRITPQHGGGKRAWTIKEINKYLPGVNKEATFTPSSRITPILKELVKIIMNHQEGINVTVIRLDGVDPVDNRPSPH